MKRGCFITLLIFFFVIAAHAQQLNGTWSSTAGGKVVIVEGDDGFQYKNLADGTVWNTYFVGKNYGLPTYRADLQDGSFFLYMIKGNKIVVSYSRNPSLVITWTKINNSTVSNGQKNERQGVKRICPVCNGKRVVTVTTGGKAVTDNFGITRWQERASTSVCIHCNGTGYVNK